MSDRAMPGRGKELGTALVTEMGPTHATRLGRLGKPCLALRSGLHTRPPSTPFETSQVVDSCCNSREESQSGVSVRLA